MPVLFFFLRETGDPQAGAGCLRAPDGCRRLANRLGCGWNTLDCFPMGTLHWFNARAGLWIPHSSHTCLFVSWLSPLLLATRL